MTTLKGAKAKSENEKQERLNDLCKTLPLKTDMDYVTDAVPIPTGSLALDLAIGVGGYPRGSIIDLFGGESAGKSLLTIMAIAQCQKMGGVAVVWDAEHSYSKNLAWMKVNGVDTSKLRFLTLRPKEGCEIGFDAVEKICENNAADLIIIDSVPSLIPQDALDRPMTDNDLVGKRAAIMTRFCGRATGMLAQMGGTVMFVNQIRANIASGPMAAFAPKTKETTHFALRHFASLRLSVRKISKPSIVNGVPYSHRIMVEAVKNKVAPPYRKAEFDICYTKGVDTAAEVADILVGAGEANKSGAWIMYEGEKYHGRDPFVEALRKDKALFEKGYAKAKSLGDKVNLFGVTEETGKTDSLTVEETDE